TRYACSKLTASHIWRRWSLNRFDQQRRLAVGQMSNDREGRNADLESGKQVQEFHHFPNCYLLRRKPEAMRG
ncbi:hypothetical protein, partial [Vibrio splendidus]|uniref:hypothetical protein n=1 Tax=Vibrio splendidus TaxID=29497 RepID=UPI001C62A470